MTLDWQARRRRSFDQRQSGENVTSRKRLAPAAAILFAAATPALAQLITVGPNVDINRQTGYQAEEAVGIDPTNPSRLFAWSNDLNSRNSAAFSLDGGQTWTSRFTGSDGWPTLGGDPTCSFDAFGNLLAASFNSSFSSILVRNSTNAGQTFGTGVATFTGSFDQPTIKCGPGPVAGQQAVWITYNSGSEIARGAAITGLGAVGAFGPAITLPSSSGGNFGDVAIGPGGKVAACVQNPSGGSGLSSIQTSVNTTGSTSGSFTLKTSVSTNVGGFRPIPAQPSRTVDAEAGLAYDNSNGPHRGRLYMVYTDAPTTSSNDLNIFTRFSDDDGTTWSSPLRVNDDAGTNSQFFSKIALDPTTGNIAVSWYDCRNSPSNNRVELWSAISINGGQSFLPNVKVSAGSTSGVGLGSGNELGDYIGLDFYGNVAYPSWADNSNSTLNNPDGASNLDYYGARIVLTGSRWNHDGSGNWNILGNWIGAGVPNAVDAVATFGSVNTSPMSVHVTTPETVGTINFDSLLSYTIDGTSTITLQASGQAGVNVFSANHAILAPLQLSSDTTFTIIPTTSTLTVGNVQDTTRAITKSGAGMLAVNHVRTTSSLTINTGTVQVLADGTNNGTSKLGALSLAGGAAPTVTFDLRDNDLIVGPATPANTIRGWITKARDGGAWDQQGLTSSVARFQADHATTLGLLSGAEYSSAGGTGVFSGQSYAASDTLIKYTWYGDTDFNGVVNFDDYVRTDNGFNNHLSGWLNGDFDLNAVVNFDDYVLIDLAFNTQSGTLGRAMSFLDGSDRSVSGMNGAALRRVEDHLQQFGEAYARGFLAAVPEPGVLTPLATLGLATILRRRNPYPPRRRP
jgi:hypothetical protein